MAIKPILFNTQMVRAILDGRKTQTRRLPSSRVRDKWCEWDEYQCAVAPPGSILATEKGFYENDPPYKVGDILWVRETWCNVNTKEYPSYFYKADKDRPSDFDLTPWRPSIHMPRDAARLFLRVTGVRCERLRNITRDDAIAEGCNAAIPILEFKMVWNSTIKKFDLYRYGWDANPFVWVVDFERIELPENMN